MYTASVAEDIEIFFPMAALLGALLGLGPTGDAQPTVVMQASGFTRLQIAGSVMKTAIPLVLLTMAIGGGSAAGRADGAQLPRPTDVRRLAAFPPRAGCGRRDGNDFIYIERVSGDKELSGVNIYHSTISVAWRRSVMPPPPASRTACGSFRRWTPRILTNPKQVAGHQTDRQNGKPI